MNGLFSLSFNCDIKDCSQLLFYRKQTGEVCARENAIILENATLYFDTFFNCFSFSKYKKYTTLTNCSLSLDLEGEFKVNFYKRILTREYLSNCKDGEDFEEVDLPLEEYSEDTLLFFKTVKTNGRETVVFDVGFGDIDGEGLIYFSVESLGKGFLYGGGYFSKEQPNNAPKIAVGICTFKREKYLIDNLERLEKFLDGNSKLSDSFSVFISDNGGTLGGYNISEKYPHARVFENRNLGGAGGFTRTIIEIEKTGSFSHFLLMDDDVVFNTVIFEKLYGILAYAKDIDNLAVGGAMLTLNAPNCQYEFGADWRGDKLYPLNRNFNLNCPTFVAINERDNQPDYNAWWFNCMPLTALDNGLPLPLFIKGDDIEFGLRWKGNVALFNGIAVWHEHFDAKYSGELEYYIKRNELVINALHRKKLGGFFHANKLIKSIASQVISQRYAVARLVFKAYNDFLKGPDFLLGTDGETLHKELRKGLPRLYSGEELKELGYDVDREYFVPKKKRKFVRQMLSLNGYLIPNCFYKKEERKKGRLVRLTRAKPVYFYKSSLTIQYNRSSDRGMVTRQSRLELIKIGFRLVGVWFKTVFKFSKARKLYDKKFKELSSLSTWKTILGIEVE